MKPNQRLLLENKAWAKERVEEDPEFFQRLLKLQTPEFLWIGCSDSRVPANEITGTRPGEIFVHRNVANLVVHTDLNMLSVLEFAVHHLHVKHVIVCGHYGCGGVKAAMTRKSFGILNKWLRNIKDVHRLHEAEISKIEGESARVDRLVELSTAEQVMNLAKTSIVQRAWRQERDLQLHGWVYGLNDGILKPMIDLDRETGLAAMPDLYRYEDL